ncbi:MAG: hypothetical protein JNK82_38230 [Myxococcaceae bacterium]|nr:hypothetical protein [Myxococcaceae bacterium]
MTIQRPVTSRNLGATPSPNPAIQDPIIDVEARVTPRIEKPIIPLWFLNDAYEAKVDQAVKVATVRAGQAGEMTDRAFESALYRTPTAAEMSLIKRTAERMAVDGRSMAEIARFLEEATQALPEAQALRIGLTSFKQVTQELLGREVKPRELAGIRETLTALYRQGKGPVDVKAALEAQIKAGPEYRKLHAGETVAAQYQAALQRAPNEQELAAGIATASALIDQGKTVEEVDAALAGGLRGTMEYSEKFGAMRALADQSWGVEAEMAGSGWCAAGVERTIERAMGIQVWGNAKDLQANLPGTGRFQQVDLSLEEALKHPGLILVWQSSGASAAGRIYGHTAITTGDGRSSNCDYHEADTLSTAGYREGLTVWMPIG